MPGGPFRKAHGVAYLAGGTVGTIRRLVGPFTSFFTSSNEFYPKIDYINDHSQRGGEKTQNKSDHAKIAGNTAGVSHGLSSTSININSFVTTKKREYFSRILWIV
jgi:hypothetical protein